MNPEDVLRQAFEARAATVDVAPDALGSIRTRIAAARTRTQRRTLTMGLASLATGAVAAVTVVVVGLGSCLPPNPTSVHPGATSDPVPTDPVPTDPSAGPTPSGVAARLPVYFVGVVRTKLVLYREFHTRTPSPDTLPARINQAVAVMLRGEPADPDYTSPWPAGASVRGVEIDGDVAVVDLAGASRNDVGSESAHIAVQQLVWTVTGVTADRGMQLSGVRLLFDGSAVTEVWGHVQISGDLTRGPALETLAPVWLISPQHGDTVGRTFQVHIGGAVSEATAILRVRAPSGTMLQQKTVTLSIGRESRGEALFPLTLAPGRYTLDAVYFSADDGSVQALDDHDITVS